MNMYKCILVFFWVFLHTLITRAARFSSFFKILLGGGGGGGGGSLPSHTRAGFSFFFIRSKLTNKHYSSFKKALNEHFQCIVSG